MASKDVTGRLRADSAKLSPDLRRARRKYTKFGRGVSKDLRKSFSKVKGTLGTVAGFGGIVGFASLGRDVLDFEKKLKRLEIQAGASNLNLNNFRGEIGKVSNATGQSRDDLLSAAQTFVSITGDAKTAQAALGLFGKVSTATGTNLEDVARAAASLSNNLGIKDVRQMEDAFSGMTAQGKKGAIELRELAGLLPSLADPFQQFALKGPEALKSLGANLQIIRRGFSGGSEAATGLQALMTKIQKNAKKFKGVEIFTAGPGGTKQLRDFNDIVNDIGDSKLARNPTKLIKALGSVEAFKAFTQLQKGKVDLAAFNEVAKDGNVILRDFDDFSRGAAGKMAKAWERVKNKFAEVFTPERIDKLADAMLALADTIGFLVENAKTLALVFGTAKLASFAIQLNQAAVGAGKFATALGKGSAGIGVMAAAAAGFTLGSMLDEWLGISDAISDVLTKQKLARADQNRQLQDSLENLGAITRFTTAGGVPLTPKQELSARRAVFAAQEKPGLLTEAGQVTTDPAILNRTFGGVGASEQLAALQFAIEKNNERLDRENRRIEQSFGTGELLKAPEQKVNVLVTVDKEGLMNARVAQERKDRRKAAE